ncbi:TPA: polysaccharide lyase [Raoultella ornithinolytica]
MRLIVSLLGLNRIFSFFNLFVYVWLLCSSVSFADELNVEALRNKGVYNNNTIQNQNGIRNYQMLGSKGNVFRVFYPAGSYDPRSMKEMQQPYGGMNFKWSPQSLRGRQCALIQYSVRFPDDFDFVKGGKLPGLYGGIGNSGGVIPDGYDGFSVRLIWGKNGIGKVYAYIPQTQNIQKWGVGIADSKWSFTRGKWETITLQIKLNSVGLSNGKMKLWLNNQLVIDRTNIVYRKSNNLSLDGVMFSTFFGGNNSSFAPKRDQYIDFRNIKMADSFSKEMSCEI